MSAFSGRTRSQKFDPADESVLTAGGWRPPHHPLRWTETKNWRVQ